MPQSYAALYVHAVFSTKDRFRWITGEVREELYAYMGGIARDLKCKLLKAGGGEDHVHLVLSLSRETSVSRALKDIKGGSSEWMHGRCARMKKFAWQAGYSAFSISHSDLDNVMNYLSEQEEHHRRVSFQEELIQFLERYAIEYDPKYLFEE